MSKTAFLVLLATLAGTALGLGMAVSGLTDRAEPAPSADPTRPGAVPRDATERRLIALEAALVEEAARARALEARLASLAERVASFESERADAALDTPADLAPAGEARGATGGPPRPPDRFDPAAATSSRISRLVASGFDEEEADWIVRRESELEMEALRRRYEATQNGERFTAELFTSAESTLREELGEEDYERYREATGRPTRIRVDQVLASSPAEAAGIEAGDEILAYDGQRIFDMGELQRLTLAGEPGRSVTLRILRDGVERLVVLPRGPIGVQTRGVHGGGPRDPSR